MSETKMHPHYLLSLDGNQWCATYPDFINLQESVAAFGDTPNDAIKELFRTNKNDELIHREMLVEEVIIARNIEQLEKDGEIQ